MADSVIQSGVQTQVVAEFWNEQFLKRLEAGLILKGFGRTGSIPENEGDRVHWLRVENIADVTSSLSEGYDPDAQYVSATDLTADLQEEGSAIRVATRLMKTSVRGTLTEFTNALLYQARKRIDTVLRDVAFGGSSKYYASASQWESAVATTDKLSGIDVSTVVAYLRNKSAPTFSDGFYVGLIHPYVAHDLRRDGDWLDASKYVESGVKRIYQGEIGTLHGVRFIETTQAPIDINSGSAENATSGSALDVYKTLIFGPDFFGVSELYGLKIITRIPAPESKLEQWGTIGWKSSFATRRLNEDLAYLIYSSSSLSTL